MADAELAELGDKQVRYLDHTWTLTGGADVRNDGELLAVEAEQADDVRHQRATLFFGLEGSSASLNPGNLDHHFDRLERTAEGYRLVVKTDRRTYRYVLERLEYE
ncbi:hypothetical protein [Haloarcula sp. JP-L23]|uniref:hypothetical protein n=1 Tax=Haloarcula sp. JP-L23 TaxID=2716717 RepID=UPI00140F0F9C|nr:hypothetical protein G9465_01120 [Haloarcula sp. JP-L23]